MQHGIFVSDSRQFVNVTASLHFNRNVFYVVMWWLWDYTKSMFLELMKYFSPDALCAEILKRVCLKMQRRCNINILSRIRDEDTMLHSDKLHFFWLPARSHESDSAAPNVEFFYLFSQFVSRALKLKTWDAFLYWDYKTKTSRSNLKTYDFVNPNNTQ